LKSKSKSVNSDQKLNTTINNSQLQNNNEKQPAASEYIQNKQKNRYELTQIHKKKILHIICN
jgi:hypothetical protein